jgi:N-Acetylglucosaminyltransferase-IV (GnT-IV) conserved region
MVNSHHSFHHLSLQFAFNKCFRFAAALDAGLLEVIVPPSQYYPSLDYLPSTFDDPEERMRLVFYACLLLVIKSRGK